MAPSRPFRLFPFRGIRGMLGFPSPLLPGGSRSYIPGFPPSKSRSSLKFRGFPAGFAASLLLLQLVLGLRRRILSAGIPALDQVGKPSGLGRIFQRCPHPDFLPALISWDSPGGIREGGAVTWSIPDSREKRGSGIAAFPGSASGWDSRPGLRCPLVSREILESWNCRGWKSPEASESNQFPPPP